MVTYHAINSYNETLKILYSDMLVCRHIILLMSLEKVSGISITPLSLIVCMVI